MFCTNCGNKIKEEESFCIKCGKSKNVGNSTSGEATNEKWWFRLFKVLYIASYLPLLGIIPLVWSENTERCYSYSCYGSTSEAFWYSLLTLVIYVIVIRLIKIAVLYIAIGRKPNWKGELNKFFLTGLFKH